MKVPVYKKWVIGLAFMLFLSTPVLADLVSYNITFDSTGAYSGGGGDGDGWTYYSSMGAYVMWFYVGPYNANQQMDLTFRVCVKGATSGRSSSYDVSMGWTTSAWTSTSHPTTSTPNLSSYLSSTTVVSGQDIVLGESLEYNMYDTLDYYPTWLFVAVSGKNLNAYREFLYDVYSEDNGGDDSGDDSDDEEEAIGACCNVGSGACYYTTTRTCSSGYSYLGDGTLCSACSTSSYTWDYGDAPSTYPVLKADNGARHSLSALYLGENAMADADGQPSAAANLDLFDDGVTFLTDLKINQTCSVDVVSSDLGVLNAWLDLNIDGDWADAGEHILTDEPVTLGENTLSFSIPSTAKAGTSYMRFRVSSSEGISYSGLVSGGEVEDYAVTILTGNSSGNPGGPDDPSTFTVIAPTQKFTVKWDQAATMASSSLASGWDVATNYYSGPTVVDEWKSSNTQPVVGFRWWGAFDAWTTSESFPSVTPSGFHIGIWADNTGQGKPSYMVWETTLTNYAWAYTGRLQDARGYTGGETVFEFTGILSQDEWFSPASDATYWISFTAIYPQTSTVSYPWGWLTRTKASTYSALKMTSFTASTGSTGTWPPSVGCIYNAGSTISYNNTGWDMAFDLITRQSGGNGAGSSDLSSVIGDLNGDGVVDVKDVSILVNHWLN